MSAADVARRYVAAVGDHDLDAVGALLDDDLVAEFAGERFGKPEWHGALGRLLPALERNDGIRAVGDGECAAVDYDFVTRTPAGTVRCVELVRVVDGRITEVELILDRLAFAPVNEWLEARAVG